VHVIIEMLRFDNSPIIHQSYSPAVSALNRSEVTATLFRHGAAPRWPLRLMPYGRAGRGSWAWLEAQEPYVSVADEHGMWDGKQEGPV